MFATNFPTVGHRHALAPGRRARAAPEIEARAARRHGAYASSPVSEKIDERTDHDREGVRHPAAAAGRGEHTHASPPARSRFGVEYRDLDPESLARDLHGQPASTSPSSREQSPEGGFTDEGVTIHVFDADDGHEYLRFDVFDDEPHYHYIHRTVDDTVVNNVIDFDAVAHGDMLRVDARAPPHPAARDARGGRGWRGGGGGRSRPGDAAVGEVERLAAAVRGS